ncbi:RNA polymerase sigma factor [Tuwongella immobilis]|uniref:Uncharacterized protein n=1 Tax=Tuwongella immobilis TaxID=692036 RepID=A0A6C2YVU4_9BACT|nr:sigma-70 family RNA polymerase sigma factor [Tuwongella immobilis]VIP05487.1 rna polymerase sigma factor : RNA polymerase sigma factor OS=Planctomyces maris DSM 8797 GN=PM8797T_00427 PE=3 SV=1: Sigma70_r2: Sigma70_r4_2 [Tuwongella immobilis]VTS08330.1 rna polymerase sigma factor : RNA polymerase sigma factor OS=Planctomyces maris DSM 8797 GN=PM8797T_00427 PE=3 SV=1: Sigma70_r2: Sigma70_r4_2 [Tuwongella immobilis]
MEASDGKADLLEWVTSHYAALYRYGYRLSGSAADAEDLVQETFCKVQEHQGQLRDPKRIRNWLFRILRNAYLHRYRAEQLHPAISLDQVEDLAISGESDLAEQRAELQHALNDLAEEWRTPLILYYFEDFSYRDIAEQMDLPIGTVMSRLARAKAYLRQRLTGSHSPASESLPASE